MANLHEKKYTARTLARKISSLRSFWHYLTLQKEVSQNPWRLISLPKRAKTLPDILSKAQMATLLNSLKTSSPAGIRDKTICELLYGSGIRVSELVQLNIQDIN
ncbi:MAG: site-specific recombinase XerD, partial [Candidatus Marinamargulisbacteria bacterium]